MFAVRNMVVKLASYLSLLILAIFVIGCSDTVEPTTGQGQLVMKMVDSPGAYEQVNIVVQKVEVHAAGSDSTSGWLTLNENAATYDLLKLRNGASAVLGSGSLDAGHYTQIRLILGTGSNVVINGSTFQLDVSSGAQTGVKLNHEFDIQAGQVYSLLLDFNAQNSIILTGTGQYKLKPVIRVVPTVISGTISGVINPDSVKTTITATNGADTVSTISDSTNGNFKLMALLAGTYDLTFSPDQSSIFKDTTITGVTVTAEQNTNLGNINLSSK